MEEKIMEQKRETEHIVAILDLLGASDIIKSENSEAVLNAISNIFISAEVNWPFVSKAPKVLHDIKCVTFSDNIAFALDLSRLEDKEDAIKSFIKYISVFQGAALKNSFFFRGGIAMGPLYMDSKTNFIWGKALVEAHILEEKTAIYPRVVLSSQFECFDLSSIPRVGRDLDGMYFVDYVPIINKLYPDWIKSNKAVIQREFERREGMEGQERVLQKYGWLQNYIERCERKTVKK